MKTSSKWLRSYHFIMLQGPLLFVAAIGVVEFHLNVFSSLATVGSEFLAMVAPVKPLDADISVLPMLLYGFMVLAPVYMIVMFIRRFPNLTDPELLGPTWRRRPIWGLELTSVLIWPMLFAAGYYAVVDGYPLQIGDGLGVYEFRLIILLVFSTALWAYTVRFFVRSILYGLRDTVIGVLRLVAKPIRWLAGRQE